MAATAIPKAHLTLGSLSWRVDPNSVDWSFQMDTARIETIGGQVVQLLGSTLSDLTVQGDFGQDTNNKQESWQLANTFHIAIKKMMDQQVEAAKINSGSGGGAAVALSGKTVLSDSGPVPQPLPFTYNDGVHNWTFQVMIKAIEDPSGGSLTHAVGRSNYKYKLTLFVVQSDSDQINKIASDFFLQRLSLGLGWKQSAWNGPLESADGANYFNAHGGVGGILTQQGGLVAQPANPGVSTPVTPGGTGGKTRVG